LQRVGQLGPDLVLLVGREDVDDPVHRLRRVLGVEGAEHEVSRRPNSPSPPGCRPIAFRIDASEPAREPVLTVAPRDEGPRKWL
jgi:hypothetical protein